MKYGIKAQLPAAGADLARRFHAAILMRMHQVQQGSTPALEDPLDCAIAAMHRWEALRVEALRVDAGEPVSARLFPGLKPAAGGGWVFRDKSEWQEGAPGVAIPGKAQQ